ncbi:MAG: FAD-dependent monooxygenase, partial [Paracoccaceae bacterium]|nr:FAD-dependent monooxygenase [Paracoccaceae bacterium]
MKKKNVDIFISGAGPAGLLASLSFASLGYSVFCVDPKKPVTQVNNVGADLRTTAFLQPAKSFMESLGLWEKLEPHAIPMDIMRIIDAEGDKWPPREIITKDFLSSDISELPFGWNIPNWLLRRTLMEKANNFNNLELGFGLTTSSFIRRDDAAFVYLDDGSQIKSKLVIGADGRDSLIRSKSQIQVSRTEFSQNALTFVVTHEKPHQNASIEIHRSGGPFTFVPMADFAGKPCSSVVWMESKKNVKRLLSLEVEQFEEEIYDRSCTHLGKLKIISHITDWPIISQISKQLTAKRTALIAEAAHVLPPIGAQGLNMSVADIKALYELAKDTPRLSKVQEILDKYDRL